MGWRIICPDEEVRHFAYVNKEDAEFDAKLMDEQGCNLYDMKPAPLLERRGLPPCEGIGHRVVAIGEKDILREYS